MRAHPVQIADSMLLERTHLLGEDQATVSIEELSKAEKILGRIEAIVASLLEMHIRIPADPSCTLLSCTTDAYYSRLTIRKATVRTRTSHHKIQAYSSWNGIIS